MDMTTAQGTHQSDGRTDFGEGRFWRLGSLVFKRAEKPWEFEQVHRLNYETFVREIPQHHDDGRGILVDKFHDKNTYFIALRDDRVVGMIAVHDRPPFSVADKLADPNLLETLGERLMEVRLLAIEPGMRKSLVFPGLTWFIHKTAHASGYTHLLISGVAERLSMYRRLGFSPLGPPVTSGKASFVPMALRVEEFPESVSQIAGWWRTKFAPAEARGISLMPGPVKMANSVAKALAEPAISHRTSEFIDLFQHTRRRLSDLAGGMDVALIFGSGTVANDAVGATLSADSTISTGLMLTNGEFGRRLIEQAKRFALRFRTLDWDWGRPWNTDQIADALRADPKINWIWGVHLESSTGVLNDLPALLSIARERNVRVCADCVSGIGAIDLCLPGLHLAAGASGKCFGAMAGVGIVLAAPGGLEGVRSGNMPTHLDLPSALAAEGSRFTFPSQLVRALHRALDQYETPALRQQRYRHFRELGRYVRDQLRAMGIEPLAAESCAAPVITSFRPPTGQQQDEFLRYCSGLGYDLSGRSVYLRRRGLVQIATMGDVSRDDCRRFFEKLAGDACKPAHAATSAVE